MEYHEAHEDHEEIKNSKVHFAFFVCFVVNKRFLNKFIPFTSIKPHLTNLFRHKPHHKYDYGGGK